MFIPLGIYKVARTYIGTQARILLLFSLGFCSYFHFNFALFRSLHLFWVGSILFWNCHCNFTKYFQKYFNSYINSMSKGHPRWEQCCIIFHYFWQLMSLGLAWKSAAKDNGKKMSIKNNVWVSEFCSSTAVLLPKWFP